MWPLGSLGKSFFFFFLHFQRWNFWFMLHALILETTLHQSTFSVKYRKWLLGNNIFRMIIKYEMINLYLYERLIRYNYIEIYIHSYINMQILLLVMQLLNLCIMLSNLVTKPFRQTFLDKMHYVCIHMLFQISAFLNDILFIFFHPYSYIWFMKLNVLSDKECFPALPITVATLLLGLFMFYRL